LRSSATCNQARAMPASPARRLASMRLFRASSKPLSSSPSTRRNWRSKDSMADSASAGRVSRPSNRRGMWRIGIIGHPNQAKPHLSRAKLSTAAPQPAILGATMEAGTSQLTMTVLMTPDMANFSGNVHGGTLLKYLDEVAYACASRYAGCYVVTLSVDQVM